MARRPGQPAATDGAPADSQTFELIHMLANDGGDTSRLLELYYWTREPGIVELIRAYLDLPERVQQSLSTFLLNGPTKSISSAFDPQGRLVLGRQPRRQPDGAADAKHRQN